MGDARATAVAAALLAICGAGTTPAVALERPGDALHAYALEEHARAEAALVQELTRTIDGSAERDRFDLYRMSNQLCGTWSQVAFLQSLLELSAAVESPPLENALRATLRGQAQFVLWELGQADESLAQSAIEQPQPEHVRWTATIRAFLSQVAGTIGAIDADERMRAAMASDPPRQAER